ncbi:Pro-neuregulin-3, membrane-bound isoform [Microtus ochrogaster]|uniref:Pro-neuregulin-3, membrane-bound isoform n=1 Tax=Microtus ochrogaster TaxID=79684 RepID=A0A8J6KSB0_MICOH|nr:Pro-neuregulin-3, membrane-bound isoform [Microtus ochrogaster]
MPSWPTAAYATSSYLHDSTPSWTLSPFQDAAAASSSSPSSTSSTTTTPETSTSPKFHDEQTRTRLSTRAKLFVTCSPLGIAFQPDTVGASSGLCNP